MQTYFIIGRYLDSIFSTFDTLHGVSLDVEYRLNFCKNAIVV